MMTRNALTLIALAATVALAACGEKTAEAPMMGGRMDKDTMPMGGGMTKDGMKSGAMAGMGMEAKTAKGTGVVSAIDKDTGAITIDHGAIPEAGWPAMTMAFKAGSPQMLDAVKVGDEVAFDLKLQDGGGEITTIQRQ